MSAKKRRRLQRGQAMVEYSVIAHAILIGGAALAWPFFTVFMNAMNKYYEGLFTLLTSPLP